MTLKLQLVLWTLAVLLAWWTAHAIRASVLLLRIPSPEAPSWLTGHLSALTSPKTPFILSTWASSCGSIMRLRLISTPLVVVTDPAAASQLLKRGPTYLPKPRSVYSAFEVGIKPPTPNILSRNDGPAWRAVRAAVARSLSATSLREVFPRVVDLTDRTMANVASAGPAARHDVSDLAKRITSDVMGTLLFGQDLGGVDGREDPYMSIINDLTDAGHQRALNPARPWMALWDKQAQYELQVYARNDKLLGDKLAAIKRNPPPEYTIIGQLLHVVDQATGHGLTDAELKSEMGIIFAAGFETTSHAITWSLGLLASHPEVQARLLQELEGVGLAPSQQHPTPRDFESGDLGRLPFLAAVIKEALRLFAPAALGTTRYTDREVQVSGYTIPKGTLVMIPPLVIGNQTRLFSQDAAQFKPERWLTMTSNGASMNAKGSRIGELEEEHHGEAAAEGGGGDDGADLTNGTTNEGTLPDMLVFSTGPRDCVGRTLAMLELQAVVGMMVGRFRWEVDAKGAEDLRKRAQYHLTLAPIPGQLLLRAVPRTAA